MRTIETVMHRLTDAKSITQDILEMLRMADPEFSEKESRFLQAAASLKKEIGNSVSPSANEYLSAMEEKFASSVIFIGWQGFQLNLSIYHDPVNVLLLEEDYEMLHQERRLGTIPAVNTAQYTICSFCDALKHWSKDYVHLIEDITDFYSYLETVGYKIAHYYGYRMANRFLPHVIPGYISDEVHTRRYTTKLQEYLNIKLELIP